MNDGTMPFDADADVAEHSRLRLVAQAAQERAERLLSLTGAWASVATDASLSEVAHAIVTHVTAAYNAVGTVIARLSDDGETLDILDALDMPHDVAD